MYVSPRACAAVSATVAVAVLVGWAADIAVLTSGMPGLITMKPNSAVGLLLSAASLWLVAPDGRTSRETRLAHALAGCTMLLGVVTLLQYALLVDLGIDQLLFRVEDTGATPTPGRMAVTTALFLVLYGATLLTLAARRRAVVRVNALLLAAAAVVPAIVLVGYLYRVVPVRGMAQGIPMAPHSAFAALTLCLGALAARPEWPLLRMLRASTPGGVMVRGLLPVALLAPFGIGLLEHALESAGVLNVSQGNALSTVAIIALLAWMVWRTAADVDRASDARAVAVADRAKAESARRSAEAGNRAKSEFLATMSHELRTPLNAIGGYAELLLMGVRGPVSAEQGEYVSRIQHAGRHLLRLINDILGYATLEAGKVQFHMAEVAVGDVVAEVEGLIVPQLREKNLRFETNVCRDLDGRSVLVRADPTKLQQIFLNLLSNAIKFTPPGGTITFRCERGATVVRVAVADTGAGIPAEKLDAVFEPFVQLSSSRNTDANRGTGLGLSISRDLARAMGGELTVRSVVGTGSTFELTMPAGGSVHGPGTAPL